MVDDLLPPGSARRALLARNSVAMTRFVRSIGGFHSHGGIPKTLVFVGISWKIPMYKWMRTGASLISGNHHVAPEIFTRKWRIQPQRLFGFQVPVTRDQKGPGIITGRSLSLGSWSPRALHIPLSASHSTGLIWFCWDFPSYQSVCHLSLYINVFQTQLRPPIHLEVVSIIFKQLKFELQWGYRKW